jgi:hypothetical protein
LSNNESDIGYENVVEIGTIPDLYCREQLESMVDFFRERIHFLGSNGVNGRGEDNQTEFCERGRGYWSICLRQRIFQPQTMPLPDEQVPRI